MDEKKLKALAAELAKGLKTEADLNAFSRMLTKLTVETALNAELTDHLGQEKNAPKSGSNTRNGYSSKTVLCDDGEIELSTPRDRENTFEPQLIKKNQTRITQMDSQILSLYTKGMTTREIVPTFKEMYDADVSPTLISKVTDAVKEQVTEWQNRPLDSLHPIVYLDCIVEKVRPSGSVINKAVFLALGINTDGQMQLSPDTAAFFAVFFDFPFAFTEDIQPGGINHQMRDFTPGDRFKTDIDRLCPLADTGVIRTAQRNAHQGKNGINEALCSPQGQPEYAFNNQNGSDGNVRIALRSSAC